MHQYLAMPFLGLPPIKTSVIVPANTAAMIILVARSASCRADALPFMAYHCVTPRQLGTSSIQRKALIIIPCTLN